MCRPRSGAKTALVAMGTKATPGVNVRLDGLVIAATQTLTNVIRRKWRSINAIFVRIVRIFPVATTALAAWGTQETASRANMLILAIMKHVLMERVMLS